MEGRTREADSRREIEYPVDHMLALAFGGDGQIADNPYAADYVRAWARAKHGVELSLDHVRQTPIRELRDELIAHQEKALKEGRLDADIDKIMSAGAEPAALAQA